MSSRAFTYYAGSTLSGTVKRGNLTIEIDPYFDRGTGLQWANGPDEDLYYVIARAISPGIRNRVDNSGSVNVAFWKTAKNDNDFVSAVNYFFDQNFSTPQEAKGWIDSNGYWTSYTVSWQYDSVNNLIWPEYGTSGGFSRYTGGFTSIDDGNSTVPITLPGNFEMNAQGESANLYVSTNGYITLGQGSGQIINTPQSQSNPACMAGNPADNWLNPGLAMTDGDVQDVYYKSINQGNGKIGMQFKVYQGTYGNQTSPRSYLINIYRDQTYQWIETRVKSSVAGNAGPYNNIDVSTPASTTSQVWRGDLNGQNWSYLGTGSIIQ